MKKTLALLLSILLFFTPLLPSFANDTIHVERISGSTRYETAVEISKESFTSSHYALIASGENFPDALGGSQLAIQLNSPILLVSKNQVPTVVFNELDRLGVKTIFLAGGTSVISNEVEDGLKASRREVIRISGATRYDTNMAFLDPIVHNNRELGLTTGTNLTNWYVSGTNFPDALSAAPLVAQMNANRSGNTLAHFLKLKSPSDVMTSSDYAIGGSSVLPGNPGNRISGSTRYQTAVEIAKLYPTNLGKTIDTIYLASGENFPDALSIAPLVARENAALLLTKKNELPQETLNFIRNSAIKKVVILGGESAVSSLVEKNINPTPVTEESTGYERYPIDLIRVVDGDTIIARVNGLEERIRFIGIDTPESVHPDETLNSYLGTIASDYTKNLLTGQALTLEMDVQERDHYGRLLGYIYIGNEMVNKTLLSAGMAQIATYPPNTRYVDDFKALERIARENSVGLWGDILIPEETPEPTPTPTPIVGPVDDLGYGGKGLDYRYEDANGNPMIKGNINSDNEKIYHTPNSPSYSRTKINLSKGERYFYTEREALNAGWRAPRR